MQEPLFNEINENEGNPERNNKENGGETKTTSGEKNLQTEILYVVSSCITIMCVYSCYVYGSISSQQEQKSTNKYTKGFTASTVQARYIPKPIQGEDNKKGIATEKGGNPKKVGGSITSKRTTNTGTSTKSQSNQTTNQKSIQSLGGTIENLKKQFNQQGFPKTTSDEIIHQCKNAVDLKHCSVLAHSIRVAEASGKDSYNKFGLMSAKKDTKTRVQKYNKYRYKVKSMTDIYGTRGTLPKTRYCTSEYSSNSSVGCPNGNKNSSKIRNLFYK